MTMLSKVMIANAISCMVFGIIFLFYPAQVQMYLNAQQTASNMLFSFIGSALLFNALHLIWASLRKTPSQLLVRYFSYADFLWVIGTLNLIYFDILITTQKGIVSSILVSVMVGAFGLLQMFHFKKVVTLNKQLS